MFRCFEYTAFLWKAKGRHGTHSPFAYWLVDHVNRQKAAHSKQDFTVITSKKTKRFLHKLSQCLSHYQIINLTQGADTLTKSLNTKAPGMIVLHPEQLGAFEAQVAFEQLHPDSILVILEPHRRPNQDIWRASVQHPALHFSADCFDFGLLSPRPGQAKEHFYLKLGWGANNL